LPHHCVLKKDGSTTKCCIVFDASAASLSGCSLKNVLLADPVILHTLLQILLWFSSSNHWKSLQNVPLFYGLQGGQLFAMHSVEGLPSRPFAGAQARHILEKGVIIMDQTSKVLAKGNLDGVAANEKESYFKFNDGTDFTCF